MRICMVSDFFFPNVGGVEEHIYNLSQCLIVKGHKIVVITHSYGDRVGIRYLTQGLKVYYLPIRIFYNQCVLPTMVASLPIIRYILVRERVEIIHGHSAFSALAHESLLIAQLLNLKTVFTDHSLFGFADSSAIITNKFLEISLANCNHCICVSHTGKENTVLRAKVKPQKVSVIPNAVDSYVFRPRLELRSKKITVVIASRLVYRKGIELAAQVIPIICYRYLDVQFLIAGDGPKRWLLEEIREQNSLQDRVTLLGSVKHEKISDVLNRGHIFLNTSLTEAYCMAIVEAAACGMIIVSTKVGGIPEVLPQDLIHLTEPTVESLVDGLTLAVQKYKSGQFLCPYACNLRVRELYNWVDVATRTEKVYARVANESKKTIRVHLENYLTSGVWPFLLLVSLCYLILTFLEYYYPTKYIDIAKEYNLVKEQNEMNATNGPSKNSTKQIKQNGYVQMS